MRLKILATLLIIAITGCKAFYHPMFLDMEVPDGPPEFKAGWYDGCRSALSSGKHANSLVYPPTFGSGIYQHDELYQNAWTSAVYICAVVGGRGTTDNIFAKAPMD